MFRRLDGNTCFLLLKFKFLHAITQEKGQLQVEVANLRRLLSEEKAKNDSLGKSFANYI